MVNFESGWSRKKLRGHLLWFLAWLCVTLVALFLKPSSHLHGTHQQLGLPPCPSVILFNRPCPGCGLTTSFAATVHGDWATAFEAHPFGPVAYLLFTLSAFACLFGFLKGTRFNTDSNAFNWTMAGFVGAFILFGVVRMATTHAYPELEPIAWHTAQR